MGGVYPNQMNALELAEYVLKLAELFPVKSADINMNQLCEGLVRGVAEGVTEPTRFATDCLHSADIVPFNRVIFGV